MVLKFSTAFSIFFTYALLLQSQAPAIPLPEHPRPDFERPHWQNLNGVWSFAFDSTDSGLHEKWHTQGAVFPDRITVPFSWGAPLSGVEDRADIGWYRRTIQIDPGWKGNRIFLTVGASDWETSAWLDGKFLGTHQGGYVPFSFELTEHVKPGSSQTLTIRVDDKRRMFTLYGKQGYGNARGIWQTVYLEARGEIHLDAIHFSPDIDNSKVSVTAHLAEHAKKRVPVKLEITGDSETIEHYDTFPEGKTSHSFVIPISKPRLWTLDDPFLYRVSTLLGDDQVSSYFGMRKISIANLPGTDYPYIALNNEPIYLQLALDQSYHPEGYYTFPSDEFMREEIERSKQIGLNGIRTHVKVDIPRKLYWADRLGLLVMADLPNSWGEPDVHMQIESEHTLREMIKRDYNHPSIFSWVIFNETWGLTTEVNQNGKIERRYLPSTQNWVASMYYLARSLDATRLVEDNSICCGRGHTVTDINSWHAYLPGWAWEAQLKEITDSTFANSGHHFETGFKQGSQPNINSECGNVWGYRGSTGDVDWSWDYHRMINTFRMFPKIAGWLYTEHHDVINEWNGYWRYDRSDKETGLGYIVEGMTLQDLHSPIYLSTGNDICRTVQAGAIITIPMYLSCMTDRRDLGNSLDLEIRLTAVTSLGEEKEYHRQKFKIPYAPWLNRPLDPIHIRMPSERSVATLAFKLSSSEGHVLHRNFISLEVMGGKTHNEGQIVFTKSPEAFSDQQWSVKQWNILDNKKVNGAGSGYFVYTFELPPGTQSESIQNAEFIAEVGAKELFAKDRDEEMESVNYMLGGKVEASKNPNAYPMTDEISFPGQVRVFVQDSLVMTLELPDDPADHRGALSWHHQLKDGMLREAGSYGYLLKAEIPEDILRTAIGNGQISVRLQVDGDSGLAIYSDRFGRFPFNPTIIIEY